MTLPPLPRSTIFSTTALVRVETAFKFVPNRVPDPLRSSSESVFRCPPIPALFTRMSTWPRRWITPPDHSCDIIGLGNVAACREGLSPIFLPDVPAGNPAISSRRAAIATDAPASARPSAIPRPIPVAPPETECDLALQVKIGQIHEPNPFCYG